MVTRVFVEKKEGFDIEAKQLQTDLTVNLGIAGIEELRVINRYDTSGIVGDDWETAKRTIFSEPNVDNVYDVRILSFLQLIGYLPWSIFPASTISARIPPPSVYSC